MAPNVGVLVYDGYHELEFWYPVLRLREADAAVTVIGVAGDAAVYSLLGYPVVPNTALATASPAEFAAIVIPGGNVATIANDASLRRFLGEAAGNGAVLAAISQAGSLLASADETKAAFDKTIVAQSADELPQWSRKLLATLGAKPN
jgi:protease I